jgi:hypothetical protein
MKQYLSKEIHNTIMLYDHKMFSRTIKVNSKVEAVSNIIDFKNLDIELRIIKQGREKMVMPIISYGEENIFVNKFKTAIDKLEEKDLMPTYKRMIALFVLDEYASKKIKNKLIIPYTTEHMITDFEINIMLNKIKTRKVDFKSIVLSFDVENENL